VKRTADGVSCAAAGKTVRVMSAATAANFEFSMEALQRFVLPDQYSGT
jgi:hypothetical protein